MLVIEDDEGVRSLVCSMLRRAGHDAVEAVNGFDGVDALRMGGIDAVVTDMVMPVQGGKETIRQIRQLYPGLPVIAMSGWFGADFPHLKDAIALGANRVLEKPFRPDDLMRLLRELTEKDPTAGLG